MKQSALLINIARGGLGEEVTLAIRLCQGDFFAFHDVTGPEPSATDNALVVPHIHLGVVAR